MKTTALRLDEETHAQLTMLAQLEGTTVTDAIRQAIVNYVETKRQNPELAARAEAALADIERDAASRRDAIASLIEEKQAASQPAPSATEATQPPKAGRSRGGRPASG